MSDPIVPKSKPLWRRLLPWLVCLMVLLSLSAICEPFVANYRTIQTLQGNGAEIFLEKPTWMPTLVADRLSEQQTYFFYHLKEVDISEDLILSEAAFQALKRTTQLRYFGLNSDSGERYDLETKHHRQLCDDRLNNVYTTQGMIEKKLNYKYTRPTDEQLKIIGRLHTLSGLTLNYTQLNDEGLRHLSQLTHLQGLYLDDTQVTGDGLKYLSDMTELESLYLNNTPVDDEGVQHLIKLTSLETLQLVYTNISASGIRQLEQALPHCNIYWYHQKRKM